MRIAITCLFLSLCIGLLGQNLWTNKSLKGNDKHSAIFELDYDVLDKKLSFIPEENFLNPNNGYEINIPWPDGRVRKFKVYNSSCMQSGIQAKYPEIQSYKGYAEDGLTNIRFDLSPRGFYGSIASPEGTVYIDPMEGSKNLFRSYFVKNEDYYKNEPLSCGFDGLDHGNVTDEKSNEQNALIKEINTRSSQETVDLQTYRLAFSCTADWGQTQGNSITEVLASINTSVNRLNLIFENDLAIRMLLVNRNDEIVFYDTDQDDLFSSDESGFTLLDENTRIINNTIGSGSYDIGHIFARCTDTGGVAYLSQVCRGIKAGGVTCDPFNDFNYRTISVASHEMGHQMGAPHSFNNCRGSGSGSSGVEPGSGSTIMSYAGLCGSDNLQGDNDDYFHANSIRQIYDYMKNGSGSQCATVIPTSNNYPQLSIDYENGMYIPINTPFQLDAMSEDVDGDETVYSWEQMNSGPTSDLGDPRGNAPSFRVFYPTTDTYRSFPRITSVLNNTSTKDEILPNDNRLFTFRLIAKDRNPQAGGVVWETVSFRSTTTAGPFSVTSFQDMESVVGGSFQEVTWNVAGTNNGLVNCQKVNILLSRDGGFSFPIVLAENTENDGSAMVNIPEEIGNMARIKVEAADNIFYDISNRNFQIMEASRPTFHLFADAGTEFVCSPDVVDISLLSSKSGDFDEELSFSLESDLPHGVEISWANRVVKPGEDLTVSITIPEELPSGPYKFWFSAVSDSGEKKLTEVKLQVLQSDFSDFEYIGPLESDLASRYARFLWEGSSSFQEYQVDISSSPKFPSNSTQSYFTDNSEGFSISDILDQNEVYHYRIFGINSCRNELVKEGVFHTIRQICQYESTTDFNQGLGGTSSTIQVSQEGELLDLNVADIAGNYSSIDELIFSLSGPDGTRIFLGQDTCYSRGDFLVGFDDDVNDEVGCFSEEKATVKPIEALASFRGKIMSGSWTLHVEGSGFGDQPDFSLFGLELCEEVQVNNPRITTNNVKEAAQLQITEISDSDLLCQDVEDGAMDLWYTIVSTPSIGRLLLDNTSLELGDRFRQTDINTGKIRYENTEEGDVDFFSFYVEDTEGGWTGVNRFEINIKESVSVNEIGNSFGLAIFPNPCKDFLNVAFDNPLGQETLLEIINVQGQKVLSTTVGSGKNHQINTSELQEGVYFMRIYHPLGDANIEFLVLR